jgi:transposase InsO family protein
MIAQHYIDQRHAVSSVLHHCGLHKSSFYYKPQPGRQGRKPSQQTCNVDGIIYSNEYVVERIKFLLGQEFVDYGYEKVTSWLCREGFTINCKKVYRLMHENHLLNHRMKRNKQNKIIAKHLLPNTTAPFQHLQTDIKYIYIHGAYRNALLITVIDVFSRAALGYRFQYSITKTDVIHLMKEILSRYPTPEKVTLRTDNGSQFEANLFREYLKEMNITHEFTHVATPQENCFIESFHSIVESAVCRKYQFEDFYEAQLTMNRFMNFYNQERIHGSLKHQSPKTFFQKGEHPIQLRLLPLPENFPLKNKFNSKSRIFVLKYGG